MRRFDGLVKRSHKFENEASAEMTSLYLASEADQDTIRCAVWLEQQRADLGS